MKIQIIITMEIQIIINRNTNHHQWKYKSSSMEILIVINDNTNHHQ
jgi:hypothetical protein